MIRVIPSPSHCQRLVIGFMLVMFVGCGGSGGSGPGLPQTEPPPAPKPEPGPPSVIMIVADDLGTGDVGVYGSRLLETPNIDRLAEQGVMLMDAHSTASVCTPSRYAMQSGRYYYRYVNESGDWIGENMLGTGQPTMASVLRENGYRTALFGKWHQGWGEREGRRFREDVDWNSPLLNGVLEAGFDVYFGTPFTHNEPPFVFVRDRDVVGLEPGDPLRIVTGKVDPGPFGWGYSEGAQAAHAARPLDRIDILVAEEALAFIEQNRAVPFYLQLALVAPHTPRVPSIAFTGKSRLSPYGDVVLQMDWIVGEVMATLDRLGLSDNTLLIFTSDNGAIISQTLLDRGHLSNLEWLGQKTDVWEGGTRVPFIARWPGKLPANVRLEQLFALVDLPSTIWAAVGVEAPPSLLDGVDQWPLLTAATDQPQRDTMVMRGSMGEALRQGDWVYVPGQGSMGVTTDPKATWALGLAQLGQVNSDYDSDGKLKPGAPGAQLYNLLDDPGQSRNVILQYPDIAQAMAAHLQALLQ